MADSSSNYDMPVMVGALVVGLIACGVFFYSKPEPVRPPAPPEPIFTAPSGAAAAPVMVNTSGTGKAAEGEMAGGGGGGIIGGGGKPPAIAGKLMGGAGPGGARAN